MQMSDFLFDICIFFDTELNELKSKKGLLLISVICAVNMLSGCGLTDNFSSNSDEWEYPEEFFLYEQAAESISPLVSMGYGAYMYDFRKEMYAGLGLSDKNQVAVPADYGIFGEISENCTVRFYNYSAEEIAVEKMEFEPLKCNSAESFFESVNSEISVELSEVTEGLYRFRADFSNNTSAEIYLYYDGENADFCEILFANDITIEQIRNRRADVLRLVEKSGITPENSVDEYEIYFPYKDTFDNAGIQTRKCDTEKWARLSDELVDPSRSDERKAFVICEWLSENIAFDEWKNSDYRTDRDLMANDFMGNYSVWTLKTGVCRDIGQIAAIMLRRQGIPCAVISDEGYFHLWNLVYLNGTWIELDLVQTMKYCVRTENTAFREPRAGNYRDMLNIVPQNVGRLDGAIINDLLYTKGFR